MFLVIPINHKNKQPFYPSNAFWLSDKKLVLLTLREHLSSLPVFWWGSCCSSFYLSVLCFCFVCLRLVSCVLNVAIVSRLSTLDFPYGFL